MSFWQRGLCIVEDEEVIDKQTYLKNEANKRMEDFLKDCPIGSIIRFRHKSESAIFNRYCVVKDVSVREEDDTLLYLVNIEYHPFNVYGFLSEHSWADSFYLENCVYEKVSLDDVVAYCKDYLTNGIKESRDNIKIANERIRKYQKCKTKVDKNVHSTFDKIIKNKEKCDGN